MDYPPYPLLNILTVHIRSAAQMDGNKELITLWAGQSAGMARLKSSEMIFKKLVKETENLSYIFRPLYQIYGYKGFDAILATSL